MKIDNLTSKMNSAAAILSIPIDRPETLFRGKVGLRSQFLALLKTWHPDVNKDVDAGKVAAHIQALYKAAQVKAESGIWVTPNLLEVPGLDGRIRKLHYRVRHAFELGEMYIGDGIVTYAIDRVHEKLVLRGLKNIGTIRYPDESFKKSLEPLFPKVEHYFESKDHYFVCMRKQKDEILLSDLIDYLGGTIDPKHVAWIMSCLFNLSCFLWVNHMTINGIDTKSVFVSPSKHSLSILGGWWYSAEVDKELIALPPSTHRLASRRMLIDKVASMQFDLESIRALGRTALGDPIGNSLRMCKTIPKPMATFLLLPSTHKPVQEYESWTKVLLDSFGPRKFIELKVSIDDVYPKEN